MDVTQEPRFPDTMLDYYDILGVSSRSEIEVIRAAYKALMRKYHPDRDRSDISGAKAREINEAFAVLSDPIKRRRYDEARLRGAGHPSASHRPRSASSSASASHRPRPASSSASHRPRPASASKPRPARRSEATSRWTLASAGLIILCGLLYLVAIGQQALAVNMPVMKVPAPAVSRAVSAPPVVQAALDPASRDVAEPVPIVHATSFNCDFATLRVERQVCADARLAARDVELSHLYDDLHDRFGWKERVALRASQKDWTTARNLCWTERCVAAAYDERIDLLKTIAVPRGGLSHSPSYDCDLAQSWAEEKVCQDAALAAKDLEMIRLHDRLRDSLPGAEFLALRDSQAAWMASRDSCRTRSCISEAYDRRTDMLVEKLQLR
jgi:uncharacterized protein